MLLAQSAKTVKTPPPQAVNTNLKFFETLFQFIQHL